MKTPSHINEDRLRSIFAEELERFGENRLAELVRSRADNSHGGRAAIAAMWRVVVLVGAYSQP